MKKVSRVLWGDGVKISLPYVLVLAITWPTNIQTE